MSDSLTALFLGRASYLGMKLGAIPASAAVSPPATDFLETLSGFSNFKLLENTLLLNFAKRITLIFGTNGSGKSSLCESLKILSSTESPVRPLKNVQQTYLFEPTFNYKLRSDAAIQTWKGTSGFGLRRSAIKYFDTSLAFKSTKDAVEPGRIMELTPFKLHVFESVKSITSSLREALLQSKQANATRLAASLEEVKAKFQKFTGKPLAALDEATLGKLPAEINIGETFAQQNLLAQQRSASDQLEKAASPEGLKLLKAEHRDSDAFLTAINSLIENAKALWALRPDVIAQSIKEKQAAQTLLAQTLLPKEGTLEGFLDLLRAASALTDLATVSTEPCPLCKRAVGSTEATLFHKYHDLLNGELEKEVAALKEKMVTASNLVQAVNSVDRKAWDKYSTLSVETLAAVKPLCDSIASSCTLSESPATQGLTALTSLETIAATETLALAQKAQAVQTASLGQDALLQQLKTIRSELVPLEYAELIASELELLKEVQRKAKNAAYWNAELPAFTPLLKRITTAAKTAYEQLVVSDFETRLNSEYTALAEKSMATMGVKLARKGSDASVTVLPQIGGQEIMSVLSEGEQRVHALALFFAELETCAHPVLAFDDPISSFDYNYITNYCIRLRDFTIKHPTRQIIVLTHNWEFFVQLQTTLNASGLNGHLTVQLLEGCSVVSEYSEKIDELKTDITTILGAPGEPTKAQKEVLAAKMRRLVESIVNTHVFNNQRHQYKQKSQSVSEFVQFTKLVPLEPAEATSLRDLYGKLSVTEHDDPRTCYVNTDKAMFQTRYNNILSIETAIVARK